MEFLKAIAIKKRLLVAFLDDLQWIDSASLDLLCITLTNSIFTNILIIGAYRDNEVGALHPLTTAIEYLRKEKANMELLIIRELTVEATNNLIADILHSSPVQTASLTGLIYAKTSGNPFFIIQTLMTLVESRAITFDKEKRNWRWDNSVIERMEISGNVVALMVGKIRQLTPETLRLLPLAACMGFQFKISQLSIIAEQSEDKIQEGLRPALAEGLITAVAGQYQFVHDRIQQAAYSLIPDADKKKVHLKIGRLLLRHLPDRDHKEQLFIIVDHLNIGAQLTDNATDKLELARLNLAAGCKAKSSGAFSISTRYFEAGLDLLDKESWINHYELTLELHTLTAETESLSGRFGRVEELFGIVIQHARSTIDTVGVYESKIQGYISQGNLQEAMNTALEILDRLGLHLPGHPSVEDIALAREEARSLYEGLPIERLFDLPAMTDKVKLATIRILSRSNGVAYVGRPSLHPLLVLSEVILSIRHGNAVQTPYVYAAYGLILCGLSREFDLGYHFGKLALALLDASNSPQMRSKTLDMFGGFVLHFREHLRATLPYLEKGFQSGLETGDFEYSGYTGYFYCCNSFFAGIELRQLERTMESYGDALIRIRATTGYYVLTPYWQAVKNLLKLEGDPCLLAGDRFDQEKMLPIYERTQFESGLAVFYVCRMMLCYLFGQYKLGYESAEGAERNKGGMIAMFSHSVAIFYDSLIRIKLYPDKGPVEQASFLERIAANQREMKLLADSAPMNHLHRYYLVEAERMRVTGQDMAVTLECYDRAISFAKQNEYIQGEALANELAARFWLEKGKGDIARLYMIRAHHCYSTWGAVRKVRDLEERYSALLTVGPEEKRARTPLERLDLSTVMKATHAVSSEIEMNKLLNQVMHSVIENAGAQFGYLLMEKDGVWKVIAEGEVNRKEVEIPSPVNIDSTDLVSPAVVRFVARTKSKIVLDNAALKGEFVNDLHIRTKNTRSLLCAPLLHRGKLISILYLENNLTTHAFTPERVQFLEMLLSQIAITLEIAIIYEALKGSRDHLEELVKERTSQLEIAKEQAESASRSMSTFLATMSHELRTPLNAILGFTRLMKEAPDVTAEQRENLDIITRSGGHLLNLINNVLDMSKIESGRMTLEVTPIDLYQLIQEMKSLLYVNAEERGLSFIVEQSPELPRRIEIDGGKLRQTLINLISNAIKYTKQGGVILRVMPVKRESAEKVWLRFEVEDTGPGISEDDKKRLFQPFVQLKGQVPFETGTGLGLAICKQHVDLMGGRIEVISEIGKGAVFFFEIPVKELPYKEMAVAPERGRIVGLEKGQPQYRLLIAEDQLENRLLLHKILEPFNFDIRDAANGQEALEIFEQWHPDLIWMDIRMPVMDGLEATHRIKKTDIGSLTKVIAITAQALEEDRMRIMEAGCDDFVRKPYRNEEIFDILSRHLGLRFVYKEKPVAPPGEPEMELRPEQLAALPSELIFKLHQSAVELDIDRTESLIEQIIGHNASIGNALKRLTDKFDYDHLQKLLDAYVKISGGINE